MMPSYPARVGPYELDAPQDNMHAARDPRSWWQWIMGQQNPVRGYFAAQPAAHPTIDDVVFALRNDAFYGTPMEPYVAGKATRVVTRPMEDVARAFNRGEPGLVDTPSYSARVYGDDPWTPQVTKGKRKVALETVLPENALPRSRNIYGPAALAANRSAVATLGMDPARSVINLEDRDWNLGGYYTPSADVVYAGSSLDAERGTPGQSLVHESMHRGYEQLRKDPKTAAMVRLLAQGGTEEANVRSAITSLIDPNQNSITAGENDPLMHIRAALEPMTPTATNAAKRALLIEMLAQQAIANRRPGGPR